LLISNLGSSNSTRNLYGDALEALIGAVFLDKVFKKTYKSCHLKGIPTNISILIDSSD
jgi:dsRNA-specific ribonuclease